MALLEALIESLKPAHRTKVTNRHLTALWSLAIQTGRPTHYQHGIQISSVRIDLTADPDAIRDCLKFGLASQTSKNFVNVRPEIQDALLEWLKRSAFIAAPASK